MELKQKSICYAYIHFIKAMKIKKTLCTRTHKKKNNNRLKWERRNISTRCINIIELYNIVLRSLQISGRST